MVSKVNSNTKSVLVAEHEEATMPYIKIEIPEHKKQLAQVVYRDTDNDNEHLASSAVLEGKAGKRITYSTDKVVKHFKNKGYTLKNNGFDPEGQVHYFDSNDATIQTFYVDLKHELVKVTPQHPGKPNTPINNGDSLGSKWEKETAKSNLFKDITRTINYIDEHGKQLAGSIVQMTRLTQSGILDKVTGKWIKPLTWNKSDGTLSSQILREIEGYHIVEIDRNFENNSYKKEENHLINIIYALNDVNIKNTRLVPSVQKIMFTDEEGNELQAPSIQENVFIYTGDTVDKVTDKVLKTGSWNQQSYTYDVVEVPTIKGYVADSGYIIRDNKKITGNLTATYNTPNVTRTVIYKKCNSKTHADIFKGISLSKKPIASIIDDPTQNYNSNHISSLDLVGLSGIK